GLSHGQLGVRAPGLGLEVHGPGELARQRGVRAPERLGHLVLGAEPTRRVDRPDRRPENHLQDGLVGRGEQVVPSRDGAEGHDVHAPIERVIEPPGAPLEQQRLERQGLAVTLRAAEDAPEREAPLAVPVVLHVRAVDPGERERRRPLLQLVGHVLVGEAHARAAGRRVRRLSHAIDPAQNAPEGWRLSFRLRGLPLTSALVPGLASTTIVPSAAAFWAPLASTVSRATRACGETTCGLSRRRRSAIAFSFSAASWALNGSSVPISHILPTVPVMPPEPSSALSSLLYWSQAATSAITAAVAAPSVSKSGAIAATCAAIAGALASAATRNAASAPELVPTTAAYAACAVVATSVAARDATCATFAATSARVARDKAPEVSPTTVAYAVCAAVASAVAAREATCATLDATCATV